MPRRRTFLDRPAGRVRLAAALALAIASLAVSARADEVARVASLKTPAEAPARRPFPTREEVAGGAHRGLARGDGANSSTWWLGTAGVAVALAVCGWASVAARRFRPGGVAGPAGLRVVGRTSLSPRHTVYLLRAGDRVLIVGTGPQGPPSLLGEMPGEPEPATAPGRLDMRVGDDT